MGVVLDSGVVIAAERRGHNVLQMLKEIAAVAGDQRAVISSVGLTELVHGIYRADTTQTRGRREAFINELLEDVEVYSYTRETAFLAGRIDGEQRARGEIIPFVDLLIGATALQFGYSIATVNVRHFALIPALSILKV